MKASCFTIFGFALLLITSPAVSGQRAKDFLREVMTASETPLTREGWPGRDRIVVGTRLVRMLHSSRIAREEGVAAVAFLTVGYHPHYTVVFKSDGSAVDVAMTLTFWGQVREKRSLRMSTAEYNAFVHRVSGTVDCVGSTTTQSFFAALVDWENGQSRFCFPEYGSPEHLALHDIIGELVEKGNITFRGGATPYN